MIFSRPVQNRNYRCFRVQRGQQNIMSVLRVPVVTFFCHTCTWKWFCITCIQSCFYWSLYLRQPTQMKCSSAFSDTFLTLVTFHPLCFIPPLLPTCLFCSVVFNLHFVLSSYVKYPKMLTGNIKSILRE